MAEVCGIVKTDLCLITYMYVLEIWHIILVDITGTSILVPYFYAKSLQL